MDHRHLELSPPAPWPVTQNRLIKLAPIRHILRASRRPANESPTKTDDPIKYVLAAIERIKASQEGVRAELASLCAGQDNLRTNLGNLHTGQDRLRVDLMERIRLQRQSGLVRDDVIGEMLITMRRQIMRLQTDVEQLRGGGGGVAA